MTRIHDRRGELLKSLSKGLLYSAPLMMAMGAAPALAVSYDRMAEAPVLEANERGHMVVAQAEAEAEAEGEGSN